MTNPVPSRTPALPIRLPRTVTGWLLTINIAVFVVDWFLLNVMSVGYLVPMRSGVTANGTPVYSNVPFGVMEFWGHFSAHYAIQKVQVWRFIGFQFLHGDYIHLLFNMFMLFMFGRVLESVIGARRYLAFYLLCGVAGPIAYCGLWATGWLVSSPYTPLVGASAGVFGLLIAIAVLAPKAEVLVFGLFPAQMREVAFFMIFIAVYTILFFGETGMHNAGGEAAHLGGAAMGFILIKNPKLLQPFARLGLKSG